MRAPRFRLGGWIALAIIAVGTPGTDFRHGIAHDVARDHHAVVDRGTQSQPSHDAVSGDHHDRHPHPEIDFATRGRAPSVDFVVSALPKVPVARLSDLHVLRDAAPVAVARSDQATGPPPRLRAPPVS